MRLVLPFWWWSVVASLPAGLSGLFAGVSNGVLLVGGGSNFPGAMPWKGGVKKYYNTGYVLSQPVAGTFSWLPDAVFRLPEATAYGGSAEVPGGVVCVGGRTESGYTPFVYLLRWDPSARRVVTTPLPALPFGLACMAVTAIGNTVYVAGGEAASGSTDVFMSLDLSGPVPAWHDLPPLPLRMAYSVAVAQSNGNHPCVYVLGGRTRTATGVSGLHSTVFCYDPASGRWTRMKDIMAAAGAAVPVNVSAASAIPYGATSIALIGGDHGELFTQLEQVDTAIAAARGSGNEVSAGMLAGQKEALLASHPGFSKEIYVYNTVTDAWSDGGALPMPCPVTTKAVKWGDDICIPGGEIKPGVRTPSVILGRIASTKE